MFKGASYILLLLTSVCFLTAVIDAEITTSTTTTTTTSITTSTTTSTTATTEEDVAETDKKTYPPGPSPTPEAFLTMAPTSPYTACECVVKIGVDGWTPADDGYNWTLDGVEFWVSKTENHITLNEKKCTIEIISLNSENNVTVATVNAKDLIDQGVVAIVGPENSGLAIPVGEIANDAKTPMIATTATNMNVTKDRPYAFRVAFVDTEQGPLLALVAAYEEEKTTAAIIFQEDDPYSSGLAGEIRGFWLDRLNLTVVSFASFNTTNVKDSNYAIQAEEISRVLNETTGVVFVPVLSTRVPYVVKAIREAGWNGTMLGGDGWSDSNLTKCGDACVGSYFTANFVPEGVQGSNAQRFVDQFTVAYGRLPDAKAALAYDAISLIKLGLEENNYWTCNVAQNRESLRMGLKNITDFQGVSGVITKFNENGDPFEKCITIANVTDKFQPEFLYNFCAGST